MLGKCERGLWHPMKPSRSLLEILYIWYINHIRREKIRVCICVEVNQYLLPRILANICYLFLQ